MILIAALSTELGGANYNSGVVVVYISYSLEGLGDEATDRFGLVGKANQNCDLIEGFVGETSGAIYWIYP